MDDSQTIDQDRIIKINIEEEMKKSYIDYSMSVIVARALPDVRDGFKPVHRRILFGMRGIGNFSNQAYKKCARVVGEVLGKYHPHGDSSVYGALVRMGQSWNMRYTLVDGQGNFGSVDGDSPAAMRYTECRLSKMGEHIMDDIDKDTVDMVNNFDDTLKEPAVMPTKIPNLLVNGGNGIAVGMATNIPTHNLGEVIDGCCAYIDDPEISTDGLMQYIPAPDFPTGAYIYGLQGVKDAYETGKGRILMRAKAEIESDDSHDKIVVTEIPYGVNKQQLIEYIAELVKEGKIDGIANVNDETGRQGMRIVVDVKRDSNANVILNKLFKMTALQSSFAVNCIALVKGRPCLLTLKDCVKNFVEHRHEVTIRRTQIIADEHEFNAEDFYPNDPVVITISHLGYIKRTPLSDFREQARGGVGSKGAKTRDKDFTEFIYPATMHQTMLFFTKKGRCYWMKCYEIPEGDKNSKGRAIQNMLALDPGDSVNAFLRLRGLSEEFVKSHYVVFATKRGIVKKTCLEAFSHPRNVGVRAITINEGDEVVDVRLTNGRNQLILANRNGRAVRFDETDVRAMGRTATGVCGMKPDDDGQDEVVGMIVVNDPKTESVMVVSQEGYGKRSEVEDYRMTRRGAKGVKTLNITEKTGKLVAIKNVTDDNDLMIINQSGIVIRMAVAEVRVMGRNTQGVRLINLTKKNDVIASVCKVMSSDLEARVEEESHSQWQKTSDDLKSDNTPTNLAATVTPSDEADSQSDETSESVSEEKE